MEGNNPHKLVVDLKYFNLDVSQDLNPQNSQVQEQISYAQLEVNVGRAQHDLVMDATSTDAGAKKSSGKTLMIFNDKSYSMHGTPFAALKKACNDVADMIYPDNEEPLFDTVDMIFYDNRLNSMKVDSKNMYLCQIENERIGNSTSFDICFKHISTQVDAMQHGEEVFIMFLTDGQDTSGGGQAVALQHLGEMSTKLKLAYEKKQIQTTIYCLGLSRDHDAKLLNQLAQSGSSLGNFIYIDTANPDFPQKIGEAVSESLGMATSTAGRPKFKLKHGEQTRVEKCESSFVFVKQKGHENASDPQSNQNEDEEELEDTQNEQEWQSVKYYASFIMRESEILNKDLTLVLQLNNKASLDAEIRLTFVEDAPDTLRKKAEIKFLNQMTFDLIQQIQSGGDKADFLEKLNEINASLEAKQAESMKIKDRESRKEIMTALLECRTRTTLVISELRSIQNLSQLSNEIIAKLNNVAYKGIQSGGLQKLIDKRALNNEGLYQKLENQIKEIVEKFDCEQIAKDNQEIIDDIGDCPFSCMGVVEALQEQDCMCIGLSISRPEAAIADPTRLVIQDIYPTYITADSFLQSAQFNISQAGDEAHGGFGPKKEGAQLAIGLGREDISGVLPLYLFAEHWKIAKRKLQPLFGLMCTLDIMGYSSEQQFTVPFLVWTKAEQKAREDPKEINSKMLNQIEQTCLKIIEYSQIFRRDLANKIIDFSYQKPKTSTRTADVIKNVKLLLCQFILLLKIENLEKLFEEEQDADLRLHFCVPENLQKLKQNFTRYLMEELIRRSFKSNQEAPDQNQIIKALIHDHEEFQKRVWGQRKQEIVAANASGEEVGTGFEKYDQMAYQLRKDFGFPVKEEVKEEEIKGEVNDEKKINSHKAVDFTSEVDQLVETKPWREREAETQDFAKRVEALDQKRLVGVFNLLKLLLPNENIKCLFDTPFISSLSSDVEKTEILMAIIFQNLFQIRNSDRVDAITSGNYVDIKTTADAQSYLASMARANMMNWLRTQESTLIKSYQSSAADGLASRVLEAPDFIYAALVMKHEGMYLGRGDGTRILDLLLQSPSSDYKDILNKVALIKHRALMRAPYWPDLETTQIQTDRKTGATQADMFPVFNDADAAGIESGAMNKKYCYRLWVNYVQGLQTVRGNQVKNLFPERSYALF